MITTTNKRESFGEIIKNVGANVRILKIDIDRSPALANNLKINRVPILMLFQHEKSLWRHSGVVNTIRL